MEKLSPTLDILLRTTSGCAKSPFTLCDCPSGTHVIYTVPYWSDFEPEAIDIPGVASVTRFPHQQSTDTRETR